jgi:AraC family transcriptional regulator, positive regulator of tynA and feaB
MSGLHIFATKAANRLERSRQWRALTRADQVVFEDDREASLRGGDFGALRLCIVSMGRHRIAQSRTPDQPALGPTLKFLFQEEGSAAIGQGGRAHLIQAGQWCAIRKDLAFALEAPEHSRQLAITIPCALMPDLARGIDLWCQPRNFLRGPAFILHATASAMIMAGGSLSEREREHLGRQLVALAEMTMLADELGPAPDLREVRRRAILDYIDRHLADPVLGVADIARAFGFSSRTVHKLFEGETQTVARAIWDRRLDRCRDDMADPAMASRSITEIAHLWGFSDSQHFSRAFKLRFGLTPRAYRNRFALH